MKKVFFVFVVTMIAQSSVFAQCNSGSLTVTNNIVITGSCIITGDLTILNGATLNVDLTSGQADVFVVRGNILLQGNAVLWVHAAAGSTGEQFIVSNSFNGQRTITTKDSSKVILEHLEFRTQEGDLTNAASIYMNYFLEDSSMCSINNSWLDREKAWLLCDMKNKSMLNGFETNGVPTELYLQDSVRASLGGPNTEVGLWLNFESIGDTLTLPPDVSQPFSWKIGKGSAGLSTQWSLEVNASRVGVGAQIFPTTKMVFNGTGLPVTGEFKVALMFANNKDTIENLTVGLQNTTVNNGPAGWVKLNNVNLGPIAWQLYALMNEQLYIKNSVVNEIGIAGPSSVVVDNSILQLAVLAAVGTGGSTMTINNSEIWNQSITAANNSSIILNNCNVYGSAFSTTDALSEIIVNGGCFFENSSGCTQDTMVNILSGQPQCNPFIPPGFPQNLSPATVTFNGVSNNCVTGINETAEGVAIFPNPTTDFIYISLSTPNQKYSVEVYSMLGQQLLKTSEETIVDMSDVPNGIYLLKVKEEDKIWTSRIVKQ